MAGESLFDSWHRQEIFSSSKRPDRLTPPPPASYSMGAGGKRLAPEAVYSPPSTADVKNEWSYTSTPHRLSWRMQGQLYLRLLRRVTYPAQVHESWESGYDDQANILTLYPSTNVWQINKWWKQYGNYLLGTLYSAQLLAHLSNTPVAGTLLYSIATTEYKRKRPEDASRELILPEKNCSNWTERLCYITTGKSRWNSCSSFCQNSNLS
jgi:hypothetical protein